MLARLAAAAVFGIRAVPVSVEVDVSPGLPGLTMVGLPDATVRESRDREEPHFELHLATVIHLDSEPAGITT